MACKGHEGKPDACYFPIKKNSFWELCVSCERIENRLFLEAVQRAIRDETIPFTFHNKEYSLNDPNFPERYLRHTSFLSTHQDPRLSVLLLLYKSNRMLFKVCVKAFIQDSGFIVSTNLLYRSHLPQHSTCGMLENIQKEIRQYFTDLPTCPCCMAKKLLKIERENINHRIIDHMYRIFQNHTLAQHPTWFVWTFKLLQTIWERDLEDIFTFQRMDLSIRGNNQVVEFRDWLGAFVETPIFLEKILTDRVSLLDKEYIHLWTGQELNFKFYKTLLKRRQNIYKEDLIIKTWHTKRIFYWCFDLQDLADFGPIDHDQLQSSLNEMYP